MGTLSSPGCWALLVACLMFLACHASESAVAKKDATAFSPLLPAASLQVAHSQLTQLEITGPGKETVTLSNSTGKWRILTPLSFAANEPALESIVAVLADLEIMHRVAERAAPEHRLGAKSGIVVQAWTKQGPQKAFVIGASASELTYVQQVGEEPVYAVRGSCRRFFDLSLQQLRDATITTLEVAGIDGVTYVNRFGELSIVADPKQVGRFVEASPSIANFDSERASKNVAVLSELFAKRFLDSPFEKEATGLFSPETARVLLSIRGESEPLTVFIGARTPDRLLHLRLSGTEQIYLVSAHLASSLIAKRNHFERSDAEGKEAQPKKDKGSAKTQAPSHASEHKHGSTLPSQVPAELMIELRDLARQQAR